MEGSSPNHGEGNVVKIEDPENQVSPTHGEAALDDKDQIDFPRIDMRSAGFKGIQWTQMGKNPSNEETG